MFVNQIVHTTIPSYFFVSSKRRSDASPELDASFNQRLHRKYLASTRPLHVSRSPTIDLATLDHRLKRIMRPSGSVSQDHVHVPIEEDPRSLTLTFESSIGVGPRTLQTDLGTHSPAHRRFWNEAHSRCDTYLFELTYQELRYPGIVKPRGNSSININKTTSKIN